MPAVPTPSRRRTPSRPTAVAGALAASAALALLAATPALADTARLEGVGESAFFDGGLDSQEVEVVPAGEEPKETPAPQPSRVARVVLTAVDGSTRRLGPFRLPAPVDGVSASPDGRYLLLATSSQDEEDLSFDTYAVPTAGGTAQRLRLPEGSLPFSFSPPSFTPDGAELLFSDVLTIDPKADPKRVKPTDVTYGSYRCALATGACTALPAGSGGAVVGFPGGMLTATSFFSGLSEQLKADLYVGNGLVTDKWVPRESRAADLLRQLLATPLRSTVVVQGTTPRTVSDTRRTPRDGVPLVLSALGGPSGALLTRVSLRMNLERRGGKVRSSAEGAASRLMTVRPDGTSTVGPVPRVTVSRTALRRVDRRYAAARPALPFTPAVDRADGSWLGVAGDPALELEGDDGRGGSSENDAEAVVLAVLDASGTARAASVGGRPATAETLLRAVPRRGAIRSTGPLEVLGYERATRTAVVRVRWRTGTQRRVEETTSRSVALRVPLDGSGRPTVLPGGIQTAW